MNCKMIALIQQRFACRQCGVRKWILCSLVTALVAGLTYAVPVGAHDFWVQPAEYWLRPEVASSVTLQVGHGTYRQRSPIPIYRIKRFEVMSPDGGVGDLRSALHLGNKEDDGTLAFAKPGAYVLVLETDNGAQSHLPAIRFNDYLRSEGLTPALEQRERSRETEREGSEKYSRRAKTLIQVGPVASDAQNNVTQPLGLTLEIVPEVNPYALPQSTTLPVRVIYEGSPLQGALVKLTNLEDDATPMETQVTDRSGHATFVMPTQGNWLLNVIWTKPLPPSSETDYETVFSSLSFGFPSKTP